MEARIFRHQRRLLMALAVIALGVAVPIAAAAGSTKAATVAKSHAAMTKAAELVGPMPADLNAYWSKRPYILEHPSREAQWRQQPDGHGFLVRVVPFEAGGYLETVLGQAVVQGANGWWHYAVRGKNGRLTATSAIVGRDRAPTKAKSARLPSVIWTTEKELPQMRLRLQRYLQRQYRTMSTETANAGVPITIKIPAMLFTVNQEEFHADSTPEKFERMLSGEGTYPTGTLTEMYKEQSHGKMILDFDVYGPYDSALSLAHNCWYGTDGGPILGELLGLGGLGARGMAAEATPQADPFVNFGQYDNDNNGKVDFLLMIHSGADAAHTGDPCDVWSHYWAGLGEKIMTSDLNAEGEPVEIGPVMTVPEVDAAIGVTAHELMHALGEPDYYDTKTTQTGQGTGDWDLGAGGSWSGIPAQTNPIHFNPLMKVDMRWVQPRIVAATQLGVTLRPRASYPDLVMVPVYTAAPGSADAAMCNRSPVGVPNQNAAFKTPDGGCMVEGFLIENLSRTAAFSDSKNCVFRPADFDRAAYASGLAIWHWDFRSYVNGNTANTNSLRYALDLEEFDRRDSTQEIQTNITRADPLDLFWGDPVGMTGATQNNTNVNTRQLGPVGTRTNDGVQTGWAFTNIRPNDYAGLAHSAERAGGTVTLDLVRHDETTVDVSGDFVHPVQASPMPIKAAAPLNLETFVYNHGGAPTEANVGIYTGNPSTSTPILTQTVQLTGFDRKAIQFSLTPKRGLNNVFVVATAAGDVTRGNDRVRSEIVASRKGAADVLIVDNDRNLTQEEGFEALLQGLGVSYHVVDGEPTAATMQPYKGVIWLTTPVSGSLGVISAAGRTALGSYLDGGGKVWFSTSRAMGYLGITQNQGTFLARYFGLTAVGNMLSSRGTMTGLGDAEIGGSRPVALDFMDEKPYLDFGTLAAPGSVLGTATALFSHSTKPANIVATKVVGTSGFRTVYTPPLQIVRDSNERLTLGREVLTFLGVQLGKVKPDSSSIKHERFRQVQVGEDVPFTVGAVVDTGSIAKVEMIYRTYGKKTWKSITLTPVGSGLYGGAIPASDVHNNGIEYYAQATTATGKKILSQNSATLPNVASAPYGDPEPGPYGACGG